MGRRAHPVIRVFEMTRIGLMVTVGTLTGAMTIAVLLAVYARYVAKISVPWTEELARYLAISITYLACGLALREGKHVGLTYFVEKLPVRWQHLLTAFSHLVVAVFFVFFTVYAWNMVVFDGPVQLSPAMRIHMTWPYSVIFCGGLFTVVEALYLMGHEFRIFLGRMEPASGRSLKL